MCRQHTHKVHYGIRLSWFDWLVTHRSRLPPKRAPIPLLTGHDVEHLRRFAHAPDVTSQWFFDLPLLVYINAKIVTLHILRLQRDAYAQRIRPIVVWLWGGVWAWDRVSPPVLHTHSINASSVSSVCSYHLYFCVAAYARM